MFEIFQYDFMVRAFVAGTIIGIIAPMIGTFLVVRRYSLMADTLAHVALAGIAISMLINTPPVITAIITSVLAGLGIERIRERGKIFGESVLALFLSGSLAISVVLISIAQGFNVDLFSFLFGSITTVSTQDITTILILGITVFITIIVLYKEFFFVALDVELARASGIKTTLINTLLVVLAAVTISLAMRIVGVLLIGALMVIPVITAMQYGLSFKRTLSLAVGFSLFSVIGGLFSSYYLDIASGGSIVVLSLILFLASMYIKS
ncbi:metal ABC transporter permease [Candidatus Peregrinibacteria bacterium CG11_big_fil_rev_8_21_14_0_20_46_8]|nr:MAG: metal ABC transporter permease [Candidatus Peregrinibacteria bacterium CG11_big_fil_rev_8_21_14_0_20_46_8]